MGFSVMNTLGLLLHLVGNSLYNIGSDRTGNAVCGSSVIVACLLCTAMAMKT
jgi:hypothetical protein